MEEKEDEYSVFNEVKGPPRPRVNLRLQRFIYLAFASFFFVRALLRWAYFIAFRNYALARGGNTINETTVPYLVSAISTTVILIASVILFLRKSIRAAVGLFILGAILELLIFYFMRPIK